MTAIRGSSSERPTAIAVAASGGESATTMTTTTTTTTTTTPSSQNQQASTKEEGKATGEVAVQQSPITDALNSSELAPDSPAGALLRKMDAELTAARRAIKEKDATLERLSRLQSAVDGEIQDLTEKLFQEAYAMVNKAEERRALAERLLAESRMKNDVLLAEVEALKILVRQNSVATTTSPGRLFSRQTDAWSSSGGSSILSSAKHGLAVRFLGQSKISPDRRSSASTSAAQQPLIPGSPQHKSSFPGTALSTPLSRKQTACARTVSNDEDEQGRGDEELDPQLYADFVTWRDEGFPLDDQSSASSASFSRQLEDADIAGCMQFQNAELSTRVLAAIRSNRLELEPTSVQSVCECALSRVPRLCVYRMRLEENSEWMPVSLLARNRIVAVGDLYTYVRYLREGILRCGVHDAYWQIAMLRRKLALARLGLGAKR